MKTKRINFKKVLIALVLLFLIIQIFRIDKSNPAIEPSSDFLSITKPSAEVTGLLMSACYDCHSNSTKYPWYTNVSPVSWWIKHHVNEGRAELNFSEWAGYSSRKKDHKLDEAVEMIEGNEMPLDSYTWTHEEAKLNAEQKQTLIAFFNSLRTFESDKPETK
jgi:hypothetical protein